MHLCLRQNAFAFALKRTCVSNQTQRRFLTTFKTPIKYVKIYTLFFLFYFFSYLCGASSRRDVCNNRNTLNKKY